MISSHYEVRKGTLRYLHFSLHYHTRLLKYTAGHLPFQNTALHLAADEGHVSAVTMLMTSGAEFKMNHNGERFFDMAIRKEHKDVCVAIVSHERYVRRSNVMKRIICNIARIFRQL